MCLKKCENISGLVCGHILTHKRMKNSVTATDYTDTYLGQECKSVVTVFIIDTFTLKLQLFHVGAIRQL